jgi:hypothetical protein
MSSGILGPMAPVFPGGVSTVINFNQTDSAARQTADQSNRVATPDEGKQAEVAAPADDSAPLPSVSDVSSVIPAPVKSTLEQAGSSSLVPAIGKVAAPPEQVSGQNTSAAEGPASTSVAAGLERIGDVASASQAQGLRRKKRYDDRVSLTPSGNGQTDGAAANIQPFPTLTLGNGSGITSGHTASVSGSGPQTPPPGLIDPSQGSGFGSEQTAVSNKPGSDFAFAVRFKSDNSAQNAAGVGPSGTADPGAAVGLNASEKAGQQTQASNGAEAVDLKINSAAGSSLTVPNLSNSAGPAVSLSPHMAGQPAGSHAADTAVANSSATEETKPATESAPPALRSLQVQITGQDNQRVDVKLIERPGALSMSVRAADGSLTRSLQEHLPELTTKLAEQQMQAEWWVPKMASAGSASEVATAGDMTKQGDSGPQTGSGSQDSGKQQGGRQGDQPNWVDELAALNNSKTIRKEYIWHQ